MPSSSAKQHRFMQAVAHSPSFAKKAGVSQSVGKDFSAADKSKTFKKGDMMKKRYDTGGGVDFDADDDPESQKVFRDYSGNSGYDLSDDDAGGLTEISDEERMPRRSVAAPAAKPAAKKAAPKRGTPGHQDYFNEADPDMTVKGVRNTAAAEYKAAARNKYMEARGYDEASKNKNLSPAARGDMSKRYAKAMKDYDILGGGYKHASDKGFNKGGSIMESKKMMGMKKGGMPPPAQSPMGMKAGGKVKRYDNGGNISKEDVAAFGMPKAQKIRENRAENKGYLEGQNKYPAEARLQKDLAVPARIARKTGVYLKEKYGDVKGNVKGMLGNREALRELRGSQLSREAALGYKKGGMAYAKGGGIESRGKTKGTVIRMAAGGSVSARADGIAQRGKTKFKNY
jgi:hypothetical protein